MPSRKVAPGLAKARHGQARGLDLLRCPSCRRTHVTSLSKGLCCPKAPPGRKQPAARSRPFSACLEKQGWETFCVVRDLQHGVNTAFGPPELMQLSLAAIDNSHLVVVELSEKGVGVGVGIEAGYAYARQNPWSSRWRGGGPIFRTHSGVSRQRCWPTVTWPRSRRSRMVRELNYFTLKLESYAGHWKLGGGLR